MRFLLALSILCSCCEIIAQSPTRTGKDYAVFFYVTDFQQGWAQLPETKPEAEALKTALESNFGFVCELVANATKQQMREKIRAYNTRLTDNDQVLFFFSMHGHYSTAGDRGYLIGKDGLLHDDYGDSWLSYDDLRTDLVPCKAKHILLALDACHSGSFGIRSKGSPEVPDYEHEADCKTKLSKAMQYRGRQYCSSGNKDAKTPAKSRFAMRFLEALRKGGDGDMLQFDDLEFFLGKIDNPNPESGYFGTHTAGGDFVFVRKNACAHEPDRDGDKVPDAADKCPDLWGNQTDGCPAKVPEDNTASDLEAWRTAKQSNTVAGYKDYLSKFPNGDFKDPANVALKKVELDVLQKRDAGAWDLAEKKNTMEAYQRYVQDWPSGRYVAVAKERITSIDSSERMLSDQDGLVFVKGGTFTMGCTMEQKNCREDEKPSQQVTLSDFYIGKYEVTQKLWRNIMGTDPSLLKNCDQCPVEQVSFKDVQKFLATLNQKTGKNYRLPTEAEWEYAARGGNSIVGTQYAGSDNIDEIAWYSSNSNGKAHPVGSKKNNTLGLFDMNGNVREWCSSFPNIYGGNVTDPVGALIGINRSVRGGSWNYPVEYCRVSNRDSYRPGQRDEGLGFRLARTN